MLPATENPVIVNVGARKKKFLIFGLSIVCLGLYSLLALMLYKHAKRTHENVTTTSSSAITTTMETTSMSDEATLYTAVFDTSVATTLEYEDPTLYKNYSFSNVVQYADDGRSLDNSLYFNFEQMCTQIGYVKSVSFRLFNKWETNEPLYVFVISGDSGGYKIAHRYPVIPDKDTTEWQTKAIPRRILNTTAPSFVAVGMQHGGTKNLLYAVKSRMGVAAFHIYENVTEIQTETNLLVGSALSYVVVKYEQISDKQ